MKMELKDRTLIAHIDGELDHHSAQIIRAELDGAIDRQAVRNLIFDFSKLSFMDSSGIGVIVGQMCIRDSLLGRTNPCADRRGGRRQGRQR